MRNPANSRHIYIYIYWSAHTNRTILFNDDNVWYRYFRERCRERAESRLKWLILNQFTAITCRACTLRARHAIRHVRFVINQRRARSEWVGHLYRRITIIYYNIKMLCCRYTKTTTVISTCAYVTPHFERGHFGRHCGHRFVPGQVRRSEPEFDTCLASLEKGALIIWLS